MVLRFRSGLAALALLVLLFVVVSGTAPSARGYSVLTHEQLIDLTWQSSIAPLIQSRYPGLTPAQLEEARAYAYGGCVIQDIGYYPFGDSFFSDLTHYVRSGDFVINLFRHAHSADELAFAIGALSHYIGDTVGHSEATNRAVAVEFPSLKARYGASVSYADSPHAHVQTGFAFDINEITKHRLAPVHYLRHIGLHVPVRQLGDAFYETYGLTEDFSKGSSRRINVRGYRFAVRNFLPRIAYAETVLHRRRMPADTPDADFLKLQSDIATIAQDNQWDTYRKRPGIGTYSLAALLFVLPKVGPLALLSIKGPTPETETAYIHSVNLSATALEAALARFGGPRQTLPNRDLDTGAPVKPGGYPLTDKTYAALLARITADTSRTVPPGLKSDIEQYYADPASPILTRKNPSAWAAVQAGLVKLRAMPVSNQPSAAETD